MQLIETQKDYWSTETYEAAGSFIPKFADTLLEAIPFKLTDRVLDIGCGDGKFTTRFSHAVSFVMGVDSSPAMIEAAKIQDYHGAETEFRLVDCRYLEKEADIVNGSWDKVASNAAFHWILKSPKTRASVLQAIFRSLKPGGTFFFEMCGFGNVPELMTGFMFALMNQGLTAEEVEEKCPWFFPSDVYMKELLEEIGFNVQSIELRPQHLELTTGAGGGLEGFIKLVGAQMLDLAGSDNQKDAVLEQLSRMLRYGTTREDGSQWITYSRLRCIATRP
ncbi:S-adenosyl-L-methionine-dependent methyltransferase [Penicillium herquei]|nr:S-adenosyl-L-methionine-dependent methyltransferase [Penicillium herquei]